MIPERYDYVRKRTYKEYYFYSEGPKGQIRKIVRFYLMSHNPPIYNLVLGDWSEKLNDIDSNAVSNNGDTDKIFATIAAIVVDFTDIFWNAAIHIEGNSPARTRRYQIGINKFMHEIEKTFNAYGVIGDRLEPFRKNVSYDAFVFERKESLTLEEPTETYMTLSTKKQEPRVYNDITVDEPELPIDETNSPYVREKMDRARRTWAKIGYPSREDLRKTKESYNRLRGNNPH